jgi:hypothetical protein
VDRLLQIGLIEEVHDPPYLTYYPTQGLQDIVTAFAPSQAGAFHEQTVQAVEQSTKTQEG